MTAPRGSARELQISAPDPENDGPKLIDLLCKTFPVSAGYWQGERICQDGYLLNSNYDWVASRVGKLGSEIVTHFGVWRLQVRLGRARILTARADLAALYNRENANLTGTAVRPVFPLGNPLVESDAYLWRQHQQVTGFVFVGATGNTLEVRSWAGDPEVILAVVRRLARTRGLGTIQFRWIHYRSKLSRFLRRQNCDFKSDYRSSRGPMIRAVSLRRFARRLLPELEHRLKESYLSGWCGDLLIDNSQEVVTLHIKQGKIELLPGAPSENCILGGEAVVQLLFGTDDPHETIDLGGIRLRGQAKLLVPVLFPNEYPALSFWDRF
jgi:hypothetical protein